MLLRQQVRTALETAAKAAVIPTDRRAIKVINYIKKHFNGKPIKNLGGSNAYSDVQRLQIKVTPARGDKLALLLKEQGWGIKRTTGKVTFSYRAVHPEGAHIDIRTSLKNTGGYKPSCIVDVFGNKKAKTSNLPYYD